MARIFICYRRENPHAYAVYSELSRLIPESDIFFDRTSIQPGTPWPGYIQDQLRDCEVMLVLLHEDWHGIADPKSRLRRIDEETDWVRQEIAAGLAQPATKVIPVLTGDGADPPSAEWKLRKEIAGLCDMHAFRVHEDSYRASIERLVTSFAPVPTAPPHATSAIPLFISHSHSDARYLEEVEGHLTPLENDGLIQLHSSSTTRSEEESIRELKAAGVIVILWSPAYARTQSCKQQLSIAIERNRSGAAKVFLIHLRPCEFQANLAAFIIRPSKDRAVSSEPDQDAALLRIVKEIRQELTGSRPVPPAVTPAQPPPAQPFIHPVDGLRYVWIPPGEFVMGCSPDDTECYDDEKPAHPVRITKGFWLSDSPVTQEAYQKVMGKNPSHFKGADLPVETVTWDEAAAYCKAVGGRLPSEAEWEYAARGGDPRARYGELDKIAWYDKNSGGKTHPVKGLLPNGFGLYDTLGNVWEWTADWYGPYGAGAQMDPKGPADGSYRVLRGGSWASNSQFSRASLRLRGGPVYRDGSVGFRCARD